MFWKKGSSRKLLGIKSVGNGFILREDGSEIYFFKIQPYNLAVLSGDVIAGKIDAFTEILKTMDETAILCLDGAEDFSNNRNFLMSRINAEQNPVMKKLLQAELDEVSMLQLDSGTSRAFVLCFRVLPQRKSEDLVKLSHLTATAKDTGLMISQYSGEEIKKLLMIYHKQDTLTEYMFDTDGDQYVRPGDWQ